MEVTANHSQRNPNWLLRGLVIFSIGIHLLALGHMAGLYRTETERFIELDLKAADKPSGRDLPVPPQRPKTKPRWRDQKVDPLAPTPVVKPVMTPPESYVAAVKPAVVEPIAMPSAPDLSNTAPLGWQPNSQPAGAVSGTAVADTDLAGEYFGRVRMLIENRKHYPRLARQRRIQGRVVVQFVIQPDGAATDVRIIDPTRYKLLNMAALEAVKTAAPFPRPPQHLFKGPIPLEICVVFELM